MMRTMLDMGMTIAAPEVLAVRGDRHSLVRAAFVTSAGDELPLLSVTRTDDAGTLDRFVFFDADQLEAALAELEEVYVSGEGTEHRSVLEIEVACRSALSRGDFTALGDLMTDDYALIDHRASSSETLQRARAVESARQHRNRIGPAVEFAQRHIRLGTTTTLEDVATQAATDGALEIVGHRYAVNAYRDERLARSELFAEDALVRALECFDRLVGTSGFSVDH